jgi:hypothetical protein
VFASTRNCFQAFDASLGSNMFKLQPRNGANHLATESDRLFAYFLVAPVWFITFFPKIFSPEVARTIQGDFESCADILMTSYWLHVELGKNV